MSLVDMPQAPNKIDLTRYFRSMPDKHRVRVITMDPWSVSRQVIANQFPDQLVVADRCRVLRLANHAMEKTRKAVRKTLGIRARLRLKDDCPVLLVRRKNLTDQQRESVADWESRFSILGAAYAIQETSHDRYDSVGGGHTCGIRDTPQKGL